MVVREGAIATGAKAFFSLEFLRKFDNNGENEYAVTVGMVVYGQRNGEPNDTGFGVVRLFWAT